MTNITVTIRNWHKFNPRSDRANHTWFRLENNFFTNMFSVSARAQRLFLFVCCEASKKCNAEVALDCGLAAALLRLEASSVIECLEELCDIGMLAKGGVKPAVSRQEAVAKPALLPTTNVRTDERTNSVAAVDFFVELIRDYSKSPLHAKTILPTNVTPKERESANRLWAEYPEPDYWYGVMERAARSPFLCGKGEKKFKFNLAFLLKPETHRRIMDGQYDDHDEAKEKVEYIWPEGGLNG